MPQLRSNSTSLSDSQTMQADNREIMKGIQEILGRLQSIESRMKSMEECVAGFDKRIKDVEHAVQYQSDIIRELESDVSAAKTSIPKLKEQAYDQELLVANKSVEIQGVPFNTHEKLNDIVTAVGRVADTPITKENIDVAYRNKKKNIVVRFLQTHVRSSLVDNFKKKTSSASLTANDLGFRSCSNKLYVNEFLLFDTRQLFFNARKFQKTHGYKYCWTINQKVYLCEDDGKPAIRVTGLSTLSDMKPNG